MTIKFPALQVLQAHFDPPSDSPINNLLCTYTCFPFLPNSADNGTTTLAPCQPTTSPFLNHFSTEQLRNERVKTWKHIAFQIVVYVYKLKLTAYTLLAISQFNRFDILLYIQLFTVYIFL
jgi:hypothetical protein